MSQSHHRIALFGGTFDPVHNGHLDLVELARERCDLDRVIFVPCARSPFKEDGAIATPEQRCEMLRLAIAERNWEDWAEVSTFELDRKPPSYSWQTAEHYCQQQPEAHIAWILGADQWEQIEDWAEPKKLRALLDFIVVTRADSTVSPRAGWRAEFLEFEHPASATAIREGRGEDSWMPEPVREFVQEHDLYS